MAQETLSRSLWAFLFLPSLRCLLITLYPRCVVVIALCLLLLTEINAKGNNHQEEPSSLLKQIPLQKETGICCCRIKKLKSL